MSNRAGSIRLDETARALIIGATCVLSWLRLAAAQDEAPGPSQPAGVAARSARLAAPADGVTPAANSAAATTPGPFPEQLPPKAVARFEGTPAPGLQIVLTSAGSSGTDASVRWVQIQGPPVALGDPTQRALRVTVPEGTGPLGFLLVVSTAQGVDTAALTIPIVDGGRGLRNSSLVADAGDDQVGLVGRRITLNGIRSEPRGQIAFRWIQVGGPAVQLMIEDGYIFSFIPPAPGIYRFLLVVAAGREISEPARVSVTVAAPTAAAVAPAAPALAAEAPAAPPPTAPLIVPLDEQARAALMTIEGGAEAAAALAEAFEAIAERMDLYGSYGDVYSEISRRLSVIVPPDPGQRRAWDERLFTPLTARLIVDMRAEGLDLYRPEAQSSPLTAPQRARLADQFRSMAEGFRATVPVH